MYGVNRIYPEEGQGEEPGKSRDWWEIPAVPAVAGTGHQYGQHGQFEKDVVTINALSWGNYRCDRHQKTLMCDFPLYDVITINE